MNRKGMKRAIAYALLLSSLSFSSAWAAAPETPAESSMQTIYDQSSFNPHLKDATVVSDATIVRVDGGKVRGAVHSGIYQYKGIPYAEARERFVKAGPVTPWKGVRDATEYGPQSPQYVFGTNQEMKGVPSSNNDQNLNIWTPSLDRKAKKPVMVWFHGGGFSSGSANEAQYNGENLSRKGDVVVVSVNHRLNALGHMDLSAYGEKYKDSANVGSWDLVASLQWVRRNISKFGGDPKNVTLFGESGGGAKVLEMMSAPAAKGLFQKGIVESGTTETMGAYFTPSAMSRELTAETLKNLQLTPDRIEELQTMPIQDIWQASDKALQKLADKYQIPNSMGAGYQMFWEPVSGTDFLPTDPVTPTGFAASGKDVPLLIGSNLTEWTTIIPSAVHSDMTETQKAMFAKAYPNEDLSYAPYVDSIIRLPTLEIMDHKADQGGAPVYAYLFTKQIGNAGVYHTAEIPFVFNNLKEPSALSDTMTALWTSFARDGVPSVAGLPVWQPYTRSNGNTMILDDRSYLTQHHDRALLQSMFPDWKD